MDTRTTATWLADYHGWDARTAELAARYYGSDDCDVAWLRRVATPEQVAAIVAAR